MKKFFCTLLLSLFFSSAIAEPPKESNGNYWLNMCTSNDSSTRLVCIAYINGYVSGVNINSDYFKSQKLFCVPSGVTAPQALDVLIKYLQNNPASRHYEISFLAALSLTEAFPCQKIEKSSTENKHKEEKRIKEMY